MVIIKRRSQPILLNKFDTQCGRDVCNIVADTGISQELLWTSAEIHNDSMKIFSSVTPPTLWTVILPAAIREGMHLNISSVEVLTDAVINLR